MSRLIVGPFNRVEGDLEVRLEIDNGRVTRAWVNSPLYRGFEQILIGKPAGDALVYAPRICGICSVSQSVAAARALADACGAQAPPNGVYARNLIHATENVVDHLTHFYLFFMPDFARADYADRPWHAAVARRFRAVSGEVAAEFLQARAAVMHLMGLLAGRWPHTLAIHPGGCTRAVTSRERVHLGNVIAGLRQFLEDRLFGTPLDEIVTLDSVAELKRWRAARSPADSDFAWFLELAEELDLAALGRASDRFLSYGSYHDPEGVPTFAEGVWHAGNLSVLDHAAIAEDVSHSWYSGDTAPPARGQTLPDPGRRGAYSWCKAPRLKGEVVEVGALARQIVDGQPLLRELVAETGGNVRNRIIARLLETARITIAMARWVDALRPAEPFYAPPPPTTGGDGVGLTEAARGSLGHWLRVENGRISHYQIISPTTWNFSPRDANGTPGALEQALAGTPCDGDGDPPVAVQHIVRSFDPCMVCTVH